METVATEPLTCPNCGAGNERQGKLVPLVCHLCGAYLRRNSIARGDFVRLKAFPESGTFRVTGVYQLVAAESELGDRMWVTLRQGDTIAGRVEVSAVQKVRQT